MSGITTAMIMAAGHGTRMRPLTNDRSKAMVMLDERPLIDHMVERLVAVGVTRIVVNVHAHADHLEAHLKAAHSGIDLVISDERDKLLETGGGVAKALPLLGDDPIFICNIDAVWLENEDALGGMAAAWDTAAMDDLLLLAPIGDTMGYAGKGDFDLSSAHHLTRRSGDSAPFVYAGVQIARIDPMRGYDVVPFSRNKMWDKSLASRRAYGHVMNGYWMHVGDPKSRDVAQAIIDETKSA